MAAGSEAFLFVTFVSFLFRIWIHPDLSSGFSFRFCFGFLFRLCLCSCFSFSFLASGFLLSFLGSNFSFYFFLPDSGSFVENSLNLALLRKLFSVSKFLDAGSTLSAGLFSALSKDSVASFPLGSLGGIASFLQSSDLVGEVVIAAVLAVQAFSPSLPLHTARDHRYFRLSCFPGGSALGFLSFLFVFVHLFHLRFCQPPFLFHLFFEPV
mmetsp:Transcript_6564/g.10194  ORF Transcript_6564/g.10194 Transcript_6564/m.10194 type:complete len:210 (-) Transcript_6564:827-1456(-)